MIHSKPLKPSAKRTCKNRACRNKFEPTERHPFAIACCTGCEIILAKQHIEKTQAARAKKPMKSRRKSIPAHELAYLKRVAALPCAKCGIWGYSQTAHSNRHQDGKGLGIKADYKATFPLCCTRPGEVGCHVRHDQCIGMTHEEADERTERYIADTQRTLGAT